MQPECRQHPTAQPEGLSKDYSARYSRGILSLSNYGPYKPCNPWHLSAGLVMIRTASKQYLERRSALPETFFNAQFLKLWTTATTT